MSADVWEIGGMNDNLVMRTGSDGLPVMIAQCTVRCKGYAGQIVREHNTHAELVELLREVKGLAYGEPPTMALRYRITAALAKVQL